MGNQAGGAVKEDVPLDEAVVPQGASGGYQVHNGFGHARNRPQFH
jgi:hypothetical protein